MKKTIYLDSNIKIFIVFIVIIFVITLCNSKYPFDYNTKYLLILDVVCIVGFYIWLVAFKFVIYPDRLEYITFFKKKIYPYEKFKFIFGPIAIQNSTSLSTRNVPFANFYIREKVTQESQHPASIDNFNMYKLMRSYKRFYKILLQNLEKLHLESNIEIAND